MFRFPLRSLLVIGLLVSLTACDSAQRDPAPVMPQLRHQVMAVNYPLGFLTQQVSPDLVSVEWVPQGRPSRDTIRKLQQADLIVANGKGARCVDWMDLVSVPVSKVCDSASRGLRLQDFILVEGVEVVHSHGPEGEHSHPFAVGSTWLDPTLAIKQTKYIADSLRKVYSGEEKAIVDKLVGFEKRLQSSVERFQQLKSLNEAKEQAPFVLIDSPDLKFLSRAVGFSDQYVDWGTNESDQVAALEQILDEQTKTPVAVLFSNHSPSAGVQELLRQKSIEGVVVHTAEDAELDFFNATVENITKLEAISK